MFKSVVSLTRFFGSALFLSTLLLGCGTQDSPDPDTNNEATDDAGVQDAGSEIVDAGPPPLDWDNFANGFFQAYCVSCHSTGGQASADFNLYDVVTEPGRPDAIRCGTAPVEQLNCAGQHPAAWFPVGLGPKPTDDERWSLVEWIEEGCLVNGVQECAD